jgi:hypothetical protein
LFSTELFTEAFLTGFLVGIMYMCKGIKSYLQDIEIMSICK